MKKVQLSRAEARKAIGPAYVLIFMSGWMLLNCVEELPRSVSLVEPICAIAIVSLFFVFFCSIGIKTVWVALFDSKPT